MTRSHGGSAATTDGRRQLRARSPEKPRERLLSAMVEIVADGGYARTSIGELARRAGVSRATFYELFDEKTECFLAAFAEQQQGLKDLVLAAEGGWPARALEAAVAQLLDYASARPRSFDFLFHEALLAGRDASAARDELGRWILSRVSSREARAGAEVPPLSAPAELILGAVLRLITIAIRRDSLDPGRLSAELETWIAAYRVSDAALRWRELSPVNGLVRRGAGAADSDLLRRSAPKGRHGLAPDALRALQRERMAYGTALAIYSKGYAGATVSDIVASSGVSRDVFYAEFHDKYEAYNEAARLVFEHLLATMASAYYGTTAPWPERVWSTGEAFVRFLEDHPVLAHFLFVGTSFPQPQIDRVNEYVFAFKVFIEDGFAFAGDACAVPPIAGEALVCAVLAVVAYQIREQRVPELRALIPAIAYTVICPFMGAGDAEVFVERRTQAALDAA